MGYSSGRPPLPAPTESLLDNGSILDEPTDGATDISEHTVKSHYSVPDDGTEVKIPTKSYRTRKVRGGSGSDSQNSLLIDVFPGGESGDKKSSRPSVRVKVKSKSNRTSDSVKITEIGANKQASTTRRISLGGDKNQAVLNRDVEVSQSSGSAGAPLEVEVLNGSDISSQNDAPLYYTEDMSTISSMPADSMLGGPIAVQAPKKHSASNLNKSSHFTDTLKEPRLDRDARSLSRERIAQKVVEKLQNDGPFERSYKEKPSRSRETSGSRELTEQELKAHSRRTSKNRRDSDPQSEIGSSLLRMRDRDSNISGTSAASKVSLNNPKLLQTVEEAIRRLILPEINEIKRQQSVRSTGRRDFESTLSGSSTGFERKLSKSSSAPHIKPKVVLNRDGNDPGLTLSGDSLKHSRPRRSSRDSEASRRESLERKHSDYERTRSGGTGRELKDAAGAGLTMEALKSHDFGDQEQQQEQDQRKRTKQRSASGSRSNSVATTNEEYYERSKIPAMPMRSELQDSELTRTSLLSAETAETERYGEVKSNPVREMSRSSGRALATSTSRSNTSKSDLSIKSKKSDRSLKSKSSASALAAAGLSGAAAAMYGHHRTERKRSGESMRRKTERRASPTHSTSSLQSDRQIQSTSRDVSQDVAPVRSGNHLRQVSVESEKSSLQYPLTQKRHQGLNMEDPDDILPEDEFSDVEEEEDYNPKDKEIDNFYQEQQQLNNQYRRSVDYDSLHASRNDYESNRDIGSSGRGIDEDAAAREIELTGQEVQGIGANPGYVDSPVGIESAVASLVGGSQTGSFDEPSSAKRFSSQTNPYALTATRNMSQQSDIGGSPLRNVSTYGESPSESKNRWSLLRESAEASYHGSKENVHAPSTPHSANSVEQPKMTASGFPLEHDPLPSVDHIQPPSPTETNPSLREEESSILEGPMGDPSEQRGHWPYEPTPDIAQKRQGFGDTAYQDQHHSKNTDPMGAAAVAAGLGLGAIGGQHASGPAAGIRDLDIGRGNSYPYEGSPPMERQIKQEPMSSPQDSYRHKDFPTPGHQKDEGYETAANPPRSIDDNTPLSFSGNPPQLFSEPKDAGSSNRDGQGVETSGDPFFSDKRAKYTSGNSHGMSSPYYDAATGKGVNHIQSKDVVALMDHLTVRDGHRNARDTEILVTLVRSAAEMRNNFEDMKRMLEEQNRVNLSKTDQAADRTISKILSTSTTKIYGSSTPRASERALSTDSTPPKKGNIFKRALGGLRSKPPNDINKLEDMLMRLLDEVESLKQTQASQVTNINTHQSSLDSYERLRAATSSGYEPEGQAGTGSTPPQSGRGTISPQVLTRSMQSNQTFRMHSGYGSMQDPGKRISTVLEDDEEFGAPGEQDNDEEDRMQTPTQEAQRQREREIRSHNIAPESRELGSLDEDVLTPRSTGPQQKYGHRSTNSYGIPKISRWSKTTTSSAQDPSELATPRKIDRPFSGASRSGSDINVLPTQDEHYSPDSDDRFRSSESLGRELDDQDARTPSPLIPDSSHLGTATVMSMEEAKYRANRNSLTLQHPQPRQGPTRRHQSHLESQAYDYRDSLRADRVMSPDSDAFGSMPSLARGFGVGAFTNRSNHANAANLSPISGSEASSLRSLHAESQNPLKIRDSGPLVPPKVPIENNGNSFYHQARGNGGEPNASQRSLNASATSHSKNGSQDSFASHSSQHSAAGQRNMQHASFPFHSQNPNMHSASADVAHSHAQHSADSDEDEHGAREGEEAREEYEEDEWHDYNPIPLSRKKSPYSPGGLLAPIEERYSMEGDRSSIGHALREEHERERERERERDIMEGSDEDDLRSRTPQALPSAAMGAAAKAMGERRVLTGPREMPAPRRVSH